MKKRMLGLFLLLALLGGTWTSALAQDYLFQVPTYDVELSIEEDGTATIDYDMVFNNDPSAGPIEFVDIGMPPAEYSLGDITAEVDGTPVSSIENSTFVSGVALDLRPNAIPPGQTGRVHARIRNVRGMVFPGEQEEDEPYASFQFSPNYFDSSSVRGNTQMTVTLVLPPGLEADEPTYYRPQNWPGEADPESGMTDQGRVYYRWTADNASVAREYIFGGGFPARLIPAAAVQQETLVPQVSGGTSGGGVDTLCCVGVGLLFGGILVASIYGSIWGARKRKLKYLPPKVSVEGHGIKRGLTSVEAGVLLEEPIDRIMTMILFSTIKKDAAKVTSREPLKIDVTTPLPEGLQTYETEFLQAMQETNPRDQRKKLQDVTVNLIKSVENKMKGFSHKESVTYYQDIMRRAWEQVATADTPEVQMAKFDEYMGWTMLDRDFDRRTRETFGPRPVFVPGWWGNFDPTYRGSSGPIASSGKVASPIPSGAGGDRSISLPNLPGSDFAASMINGVQTFSAGVIGDLTNFTGAITNRTNPLPPTATQRSTWRGGGGGGGGRSCACACACAGCACACAGGGR